MLNTFEKTKAHEARRAAIQRQMEAMEAAASSSPRPPSQPSSASSTASTTRRRNTGGSGAAAPAGSLETARRFLWDEDEPAPTSGMTPTNAGGDQAHSSTGGSGMFTTLSNIFAGDSKQHQSQVSSQTVWTKPRGASHQDREYRQSMCTTCYIAIRRLMLSCALCISTSLSWFRTRLGMACGHGRGARFCAMIALILVIVLPIALLLPSAKDSVERATGISSGSKLSAAQRADVISKRLILEDISLEEDLDTKDSPQQKALEWIASGDPAKMDVEHKHLPQRYALAVFYYSTHGDSMFQETDLNVTQEVGEDGQEHILVDGVEVPKDQVQLPEEGDVAEVYGDDLAGQPNWIDEDGWMTEKGHCAWAGIECHHRPGTSVYDTKYDDHNGVISFNMTENNVRGTMPREIFQACRDIRWMSLNSNGFFGIVESEIGNLKKLGYLNLANNFLSGILPTSIVGLSDLTRLYLDGNYLDGPLPFNLGEMTKLGTFSIFNNYFEGALPDIQNLKNLTALYLDVNRLTGTLPTHLGTLDNLIDLRFRNNKFVGSLPSELGQLEKLEILYADRNEMTGEMPTEIGLLTHLSELHLYSNSFEGTIITEIGLLRGLGSLYLDNNKLKGGIPKEIGELRDLEQLYIHKNALDGTICTEVGLMDNLKNFRVYTNELKGSLPSEIGKAFKLEHLHVNDNQMTGTVPEQVKELTRLQTLRVYWNDMGGRISEGICGLMDFRLTELKADCAGDTPKMECSCCTACFS